ncbi:MAG: hypothetical protein HOP27_16785 [Anaerolineales bacterium]|nr:hypothetical protein [Anaerolineales bacterium]
MEPEMKKRPTKRAPDVWDSAAFSSIFLASSFSCSQAESTPAHTQVTQTVGWLRQNVIASLICVCKYSWQFFCKKSQKRTSSMFNPPNSYPNSGSYFDLLKRITQLVQKKKVDQQILQIVQQAFEKELSSENVVLSRPEKTRLLQQVTRAVLTEAITKISDIK